MKWDASLYDQTHDFVFRYGEDLVDLLNAQKGEHILDLGCGTGHLTNDISKTGAFVKGIDSSENMIKKAMYNYPHIDFVLASATDFELQERFDAIFSNATLHWIVEKEKVIRQILRHLKKNGRLVLEMGAKNNVKSIIDVLKSTLLEHRYEENAYKNVWYFPSPGEYISLLENEGFQIEFAAYFKRETELKDTENGIIEWLTMFAGSYLENISTIEIEMIMQEVQEKLKPICFRNNKWYADYQRLRIIALKS